MKEIVPIKNDFFPQDLQLPPSLTVNPISLDEVQGLEPRITGSKPVVLPLHYTSLLMRSRDSNPTLQCHRLTLSPSELPGTSGW